jgi:beta-lactamase regulating signal transducer with metallopeptidase domain
MSALLITIVRMSVVLAITLALVPMLRARSAALRALVIAAGLTATAVVPALQLVAPAWGVPLHASAQTVVGDSSTRVLMAIWLVGTAANLMVLLIGMFRLMGIAAAADPIRDGIGADLALDITAEYRVHAPVLLLEADRPTLPVTWGYREPKVLLPPAARQWSHERTRIVLRHELAHIRRRDWLWQLAATVIRSVYWFHPLVWIACARLRLECERACDDAVLADGVSGSQYASHLLDLARGFINGQQAAYAAGFANRSTLERRVRAMLAPRIDRSPVPVWCGGVIAAVMLVIAVTTAGFGASLEIRSDATPPQPRRLTLLLDGRIMDLSKEWPTYPDPRAGIVEGPGLRPQVQRP